jgi:hypothetical protein
VSHRLALGNNTLQHTEKARSSPRLRIGTLLGSARNSLDPPGAGSSLLGMVPGHRRRSIGLLDTTVGSSSRAPTDAWLQHHRGSHRGKAATAGLQRRQKLGQSARKPGSTGRLGSPGRQRENQPLLRFAEPDLWCSRTFQEGRAKARWIPRGSMCQLGTSCLMEHSPRSGRRQSSSNRHRIEPLDPRTLLHSTVHGCSTHSRPRPCGLREP